MVDNIFDGCTSLVGGAGTKFDADHIGVDYARIDGGPDSTTPGYLTLKRSLSKATVTLSPSTFTYDGTAKEPTVTVKLDDVTLVKDTDFTVSYSNNVEPGTATATVTGKGNYKDSATGTFTIEPNPQPGPEPQPGATMTMHRLYNPNSGEHFYTADENERAYLTDIGWSYEGIGWTAPGENDKPVYRLYNRGAGDHHYTLDANEREYLIGAGWEDENIGWYSAGEDGAPLYRQYNPNATGAGSHNYTADENERDYLVNNGWNDEGIGWYGIPADA